MYNSLKVLSIRGDPANFAHVPPLHNQQSVVYSLNSSDSFTLQLLMSLKNRFYC